jgi:hypothetical protein
MRIRIAMDTETAEAIDTLRIDIRRVETTLTAEIRRVDTSLNSLATEMRGGDAALSAEIGRVETSLTAEMRTGDAALRAEMRDLHEASQRHADVLYESLHDDIRMLAEAVVALNAKIDARHP